VIVRQLAGELCRRGAKVTVITSGRAGSHDAGSAEALEQGVRIRRVPLPASRNTESALGRLWLFSLFNFLSLVVALGTGGADAVLAISPPFTSGIVGKIVATLKGIPSIYVVQDLQTEAYVQFGVLRKPWLIAVFRTLERLAFATNTRVVAIAESFAVHMRAQGVAGDRIAVIPNFVDTSEIRPLPRQNPFAIKNGLADRFVVMHAGSIAFRHGLETVIDAAALLLDEPEILIAVVGDGSKRRELENRIATLALPNVRLMPFQARDDLPQLRASADVHLVTLRRGMTLHSVPCKVYEIMAAGRPFLASVDAGSEIDRIARDTESGVVVEPESAAALASAIRHLYYDRQATERRGTEGRAVAVDRYNVQTAALAYEALILDITAPSR